jgi:hypothetical protein
MAPAIKLASAEGRTFALGQIVCAQGEINGPKSTGEIVGFKRSVSGDFIVAKIKLHGSRTIVRSVLQDIEPDEFFAGVIAEMERRGLSGRLTAKDVKVVNFLRAGGKSAIECGADRAMSWIAD